MKESAAELLGLRRAGRDPRYYGRKLLSIGDNMASVLSYEKGRARNWHLRQNCRIAAAYQLGCEIQWRHRYTESKRNPTDEDSRLADRGALAPGAVRRGTARALAELESANEVFEVARPLEPLCAAPPSPTVCVADAGPSLLAPRLPLRR